MDDAAVAKEWKPKGGLGRVTSWRAQTPSSPIPASLVLALPLQKWAVVITVLVEKANFYWQELLSGQNRCFVRRSFFSVMYHFIQRNTDIDPESSKLRSVRCFKCEKFIQCTSLSDVYSNISLKRKPMRNRFRKWNLYSFAFEPRSALRQELKCSNPSSV